MKKMMLLNLSRILAEPDVSSNHTNHTTHCYQSKKINLYSIISNNHLSYFSVIIEIIVSPINRFEVGLLALNITTTAFISLAHVEE